MTKTTVATITTRAPDITCGLWGCKNPVHFDVTLDTGATFRSCPACLGKMLDYKNTWG